MQILSWAKSTSALYCAENTENIPQYIYNQPEYKSHHYHIVFYLSDVDITGRTLHNIYNLLEYKSHHDQIVFYLSDVDITWRTSPNIYNLPEYKSHHDQIVFYLSDVGITGRTSPERCSERRGCIFILVFRPTSFFKLLGFYQKTSSKINSFHFILVLSCSFEVSKHISERCSP